MGMKRELTNIIELVISSGHKVFAKVGSNTIFLLDKPSENLCSSTSSD